MSRLSAILLTALILCINYFSVKSLRFFYKSNRILLQKSIVYSKASVDEDKRPLVTKNFITNIIDDDIKNKKNGARVLTRFPPEPNGYLHIGHAKSICFNFGVASDYNGATNMRFDDTNPEKEDMEYVTSILEDVKWLVTGKTDAEAAPWNGPVRHASDYFQIIFDCAVYLIKKGLAFVDDLTPGNCLLSWTRVTLPI
jgi:hypothetical protein